MKWKIEDLDIDKTKQTIENEEKRLKFCDEEYDKLKREYDIKKKQYTKELNDLKAKMNKITASVLYGIDFCAECRWHLKELEEREQN